MRPQPSPPAPHRVVPTSVLSVQLSRPAGRSSSPPPQVQRLLNMTDGWTLSPLTDRVNKHTRGLLLVVPVTCLAFSGQFSCDEFMLRAARSSTRCGPRVGSCSRVPSGDAGYRRSLSIYVTTSCRACSRVAGSLGVRGSSPNGASLAVWLQGDVVVDSVAGGGLFAGGVAVCSSFGLSRAGAVRTVGGQSVEDVPSEVIKDVVQGGKSPLGGPSGVRRAGRG
jgi:hypothetical protein